MKTRIETFRDKSTWGPGPWQDEPDKLQWLDKETGLPCLVVRNRHGTLCGYVGVPPGHPLFEVGCGTKSKRLKEAWARRKESPIGTLAAGPVAVVLASFTDDEEPSPEAVFEVHGGLTYSDHCQGHICHEREEGDPEAWWFGFDCGHCDDYQPGHEATARELGIPSWDHALVYRDLAYVQAECRKLARQLKDIQP